MDGSSRRGKCTSTTRGNIVQISQGLELEKGTKKCLEAADILQSEYTEDL